MPRRSPFSIILDEEWKLRSRATTSTSCGLASAQSACTRATSTSLRGRRAARYIPAEEGMRPGDGLRPIADA